MNSWVGVLPLSGSLAHHRGGSEGQGGGVGHCCLGHRLSKRRSQSLWLIGRWLRKGRKSIITLTPPEVLLLLLQLSLDQSLLHDVLGEHGHLLRAWYPGSLGRWGNTKMARGREHERGNSGGRTRSTLLLSQKHHWIRLLRYR